MASGKITGKCTGAAASKYDFWVEWGSTAYPEEGYSLISATAYLKRNDGWAGSAYNLDVAASNKKITVDGQTKTSSTKGIDTRNSKKVVIATAKNIRITHNKDGQKSITISASFPVVSNENLRGGSASKMISLDNIDVSPPVFNTAPSVSSLSQTEAVISFYSSDSLDYIAYSLDGQNTWVEVNGQDFAISDLTAYTNYQVYVKIRKAINQKETISSVVQFRTLPIYVTSITVPPRIQLDIGETVNVPFEIQPENASVKTISIISNNPEIILTSGDAITGVKKGEVMLTITANDGGDASAFLTASTVRRVSGITISPNEITLAKGSSIPIVVNISPSDADNKNVTLASSDESLLTVDGLIVTAVENGVVEVTATTEDGGFTATSIITIVGDYVWYDYSEPLEILNSEDVEHIHSNMVTIRSMLLSNGYTVDNLTDVEPSKEKPFIDMLAMLQNIEYNLDRINDNDCQSIYYIEQKTVGEYASNREDIWRWVQILNDMYNILNGTFGKWGYLLCSDGYPTINARKILTRGDMIGV